MKIIDWSPRDDRYLKPKEIEIHNIYHENKANNINKEAILGANKRKERIEYIENALRLANTDIHGSVLEVGAGDGWCSAYMLLNYPIDEMYIMEVDKAALESLIPRTLSKLGIKDNNVNYVLGSFNKIAVKNKFDFVVAMGALHHSNNLFLTFRSIYESLKPGGWLIAQEPYMKDDTKNTYYFNRDKESINFKGLIEVKNNERTDLFYRSCEYQTAALHAGFNYSSSKLSAVAEKKSSKKNSYTKKLISITNIISRDRFKENKTTKQLVERPENFVIYAQKPNDDHQCIPPTAWEY